MAYKEEALEFLGITRWHELGYKGKGIKIMSDEKISQKSLKSVEQSLWDKVVSPKGYSQEKAGHGSEVMANILMVCPEAECIAFPFFGNAPKEQGKEYSSEAADYIIQNKVSVFTTSCTSATLSKYKKKAMQDCIENGCTFIALAGNDGDYDGESTIWNEAKAEEYLTIGGVKPQLISSAKWDWNKIGKVDYSSEGEELDYVTIAEILGRTGTSFCAPVFAGMCVLVQQFFLESAGRTLNRSELVRFIDDNLVDIDVEGFDIRTGFGLFILPDPETIKISDYAKDINVPTVSEGIYYGGFPEVRSDVVMRGIDKLHPELQVCVNKFLEECKKQGLNVLITETLRTQAEQEKLYAQGRTEPGKIVTNCRGYQSPHCWGVAFDFCRNKKGWEYDNTNGFFDKVGRIAETMFNNTEYDLFWGGDFRTFVDKPHVEMKKYLPNNSTNWLIDNYGTPEEFMSTWYDMKEEGEEYMHRYKTVEEMPEYAQQPIQELIDKDILAGKGGEVGLDLSEDMIRMLIIAKKIFESEA